MENQKSDQNNGGEEQGKRINRREPIFSMITKSTIEKIKRKCTRSQCEPLCTIHDNTSPGYGWLLPGWVAEERHMQSGRIYRYYYDPEGNLYHSKGEVLAAWEKAGMIVLDDE